MTAEQKRTLAELANEILIQARHANWALVPAGQLQRWLRTVNGMIESSEPIRQSLASTVEWQGGTSGNAIVMPKEGENP